MPNPLNTSQPTGPLSGDAGGALVVPEFVAQPIIDAIQSQPGAAALADVQTTNAKSAVFHVISDDSDAYWTDEGAPIDEAGMTTAATPIITKKIAVISRQTREMLEDTDSASVLSALADNVKTKMANKIDIACIIQAGSYFSGTLQGDVDASAVIASATGSNVQDGISEAIEACENAGANPQNLSVLLSQSLARTFRDEVAGSALNSKLFNGASDATHGLPYSYSLNLPAGTVAYVGDFSNLKLRVRNDISVASADQGTVGGVSLFETDTLALRWTMRIAGGLLLPNKFCSVVVD
jgi:HK97 family phage major capsid protein